MTLPMFDPPADPARQRVDEPQGRRSAKKTDPSAVRWSAYSSRTGTKCDDCMMVLHLAKSEGPATRQARWRRAQDGRDLLLCHGHMTARRAEDGLDPLALQAPGALR